MLHLNTPTHSLSTSPHLKHLQLTLALLTTPFTVHQAFGFGNFPGIDNASLQELEERYAVTIEKEMTVKLGEALTRKAEVRPG